MIRNTDVQKNGKTKGQSWKKGAYNDRPYDVAGIELKKIVTWGAFKDVNALNSNANKLIDKRDWAKDRAKHLDKKMYIS